MKRIVTILLSSFFIFSSNLKAQKEATWWYFGYNTGLDFTEVLKGNATIPTCVAGPVYTWEGCFSISDKKGNFLLASNGVNVINKNKVTISNGTGLLGHDSSTQSGIVIPRPSHNDQYYVVTVSDAGSSYGINYSLVDLSENGGLGDVISKNNPISLTGTGLTASDMYENITSVKHANGKDYWLAHRSRSKFLVWLITENGVSNTPVVTEIGRDLGLSTSANGLKLGYLKFSPDGKTIAHPGGDTGWLTVGDFDPSTGLINNIREINLPVSSGQPLYGLEFSPDGKYLYVAQGWSKALRMLLTNDIVSGAIKTFSITPTALQTGPDGKIYAVNQYSNTLYIINDPNDGGNDITTLSNFFTNGKAGLGLPTFITSFFNMRITGKKFFCLNEAQTFSVISQAIGSLAREPKYTVWDFGDGSSPTSLDDTNIPGTQTKTHTYDRPGKYTITVKVYDENEDEITEMFETFDVFVKACVLPVNPNIHTYQSN